MLLDPEGDARQFENLKRVLRKEAWEEGRKEGINKTKAAIVQAMLQEGVDDALILRVVKVTPEFVSAMRKTGFLNSPLFMGTSNAAHQNC